MTDGRGWKSLPGSWSSAPPTTACSGQRKRGTSPRACRHMHLLTSRSSSSPDRDRVVAPATLQRSIVVLCVAGDSGHQLHLPRRAACITSTQTAVHRFCSTCRYAGRSVTHWQLHVRSVTVVAAMNGFHAYFPTQPNRSCCSGLFHTCLFRRRQKRRRRGRRQPRPLWWPGPRGHEVDTNLRRSTLS